MPNDTTLDAGKNVNTTPDPGKTVETPDVSKLVADAVAKAMTPLMEQFGGLSKTVNSLAAEKRRTSESAEPKTEGQKAADPEIAALKDTVKKLTDDNASARKRIAVKEALDLVNGEIVPTAREDIEQLIANNLDFSSDGSVVALVNGKHVPLTEHVKALAAKPHFKAATGKAGTGRPGQGTSPGSSPKIQIKRSDLEAKARHIDAIAKGEVEFID